MRKTNFSKFISHFNLGTKIAKRKIGLFGPIFFAYPSCKASPRKKGFPLLSLTRISIPDFPCMPIAKHKEYLYQLDIL